MCTYIKYGLVRTIVHVFHGMAIYVTRSVEVYPYLINHSCKSYNRRTDKHYSILFYSILFYMSLIVCEVSVYVLLGHECYHSEMSLSRCTVPVTGGCGRFRPAHTSVFFPCGEWQDIAYTHLFLTCSTIFPMSFAQLIAIYAPMIYTAPVHNVLDACISITRASGRRLGPRN